MLIVGDNLSSLISQHELCSSDLFDSNSLRIELSEFISEPIARTLPIVYERDNYQDIFTSRSIDNEGLLLRPGHCVLACSHDSYNMPAGYFGQVQTKGSLARLFVAAHMADPQIDAGFRGRITLELFNAGPFEVVLPLRSNVAQLYIWKTSDTNGPLYNGRYQDAEAPTTPRLRG